MVSELEQKLIESTVKIGDALSGIEENLKKLNDQNILHSQQLTSLTTQAANDHKSIIDSLKLMTDKYWWLIIALIGAVTAFSGYKFLFTGA